MCKETVAHPALPLALITPDLGEIDGVTNTPCLSLNFPYIGPQEGPHLRLISTARAVGLKKKRWNVELRA